ncbi:MAG: hypothetical protein K5694_00380 [Bacilli bacterium]|nr:hypothetical protein [Bacilli bacterium]
MNEEQLSKEFTKAIGRRLLIASFSFLAFLALVNVIMATVAVLVLVTQGTQPVLGYISLGTAVLGLIFFAILTALIYVQPDNFTFKRMKVAYLMRALASLSFAAGAVLLWVSALTGTGGDAAMTLNRILRTYGGIFSILTGLLTIFFFFRFAWVKDNSERYEEDEEQPEPEITGTPIDEGAQVQPSDSVSTEGAIEVEAKPIDDDK